MCAAFAAPQGQRSTPDPALVIPTQGPEGSCAPWRFLEECAEPREGRRRPGTAGAARSAAPANAALPRSASDPPSFRPRLSVFQGPF